LAQKAAKHHIAIHSLPNQYDRGENKGKNKQTKNPNKQKQQQQNPRNLTKDTVMQKQNFLNLPVVTPNMVKV